MPESKPATERKQSPGKASQPASKPSKPAAGGKKAAPPPSRAPDRTRTPPPLTYSRPWTEDARLFLRRYGRSLAGVLFLLLGIVMIVAYVVAEPSWGEALFGWTAPLMAGCLMMLGAVLLLGRSAGYWSAEALVAAELFLLSLQAGTYVINVTAAPDPAGVDGFGGGMVGWALGSMLVQAFGRTISLLLLAAMGLLGLAGLVRYTPLIYPAMALVRGFPVLSRRLARWLPMRGAAEAPGEGAIARGAMTPVPSADRLDAPDSPGRPGDKAHASADAPPLHGQAAPAAIAGSSKTPAEGRTQGGAGGRSAARKRPEDVAAVRVEAESRDLPPLDLLSNDTGVYTRADVHTLEQLIEATLDDFGVPVRVVHVESGPTVTQFGVEPLFVASGGQVRKVRVSRIVGLADDLALALAAPAVRIEAPVPGRPYVGIEVPNGEKSLVSLRGIMESAEMHRENLLLGLPLGRNTSSAAVALDLTRAPHMLIAGATGSGKSVCINTMVTGLLMRHGPETLRFVMVDPKRVELTGYNGIPHLLGRVITEVDQVMPALTWLMIQMDERYRLFREAGVRNIESYNAYVKKRMGGAREVGGEEQGESVAPLPYIVLIVDELADLMMTAPEDIERQLCRLAQMARATGIHLIIATQRPSVDVVTGLIKANFPTRVAFAVTSQVDSRVILDAPGAERLLGRGDMLLMRPDLAKLNRVQGCLVTDDEIGRVVGFWKARDERTFAAEAEPWAGLMRIEEGVDELVQEAIDALQGLGTCSVSLLQRRLRIGYPRAARLMDDLEARGIVGPDMGAGQGREVLIQHESTTASAQSAA